MRLLYTTSDGRLGCTDDLIGDTIPAYAILSHTWDGQEVAFKDLKNHKDISDVDTKLKGGYQKLFFCAQQAKQDGLNHFWVDTCCIDKTNNTELSEAINSMFRWYQNAAKCYVYLSDVKQGTLDSDGESHFKQSRWFTRGWTLQELLAPKSVEFFSSEGRRLGDKKSLRHVIHEITKIPVEALQGRCLGEYTTPERLSWAEGRQTTREEDGAYCLLGIFDCHLPLIYGEGKEKALKRLKKEIEETSKELAGASANNTTSRSRGQEERLGKICSWLSAPDPSTNYHKAHRQRQAETGIWLVEGEQFARWKVNAASSLWLYGIPGCGKTILSSTVIKNLLQHCGDNTSIVTVYFYFDFNDAQKQNPELMLRSLLCQLLQRAVVIPKGVDALFTSCENGRRQPSLYVLLEVIQLTLQDFAQVYIVLDALDECTQRSELMGMLETIAGWQLDNTHLLVTSRKERDIERSLETFIVAENTICLQMDVVDKDIQQYVQQRLSDDKDLAKWNKSAAIRQEIEAALMRGACGMFRWAVCQLDTLGKCRNRKMLYNSLATLPQTLDQTYDRILSAISESDSEYAMRILRWLTFSERSMSVQEIAEVVALDAARDPALDRDEVLEDPLEALNICSSLVTITTNQAKQGLGPAQRIVALAHYSVQEYLVSNRIKEGSAKQYSMQEVECQGVITRCSLKYLTQLQYPLSGEILAASALARYTAEFWSSHLRKTGDEMEAVSRLAMDLLSIENPAYLTWIRLYDRDRPWEASDLSIEEERVAMPIYYAGLLGLSTIAKTLLRQGADVNAKGGRFGNALQAASAGGHEQVVKVLLDSKADVNIQGGFYGNALYAASYRGHEQVVKMLLNSKADINAQGGEYGNALQAASAGGHEKVVKVLLDSKADVNTQGGSYDNALYAASYGGHEQVVKMLLDSKADVNTQGGSYGNALQAASYGGHEQVVKMLLNSKADINAQGGEYGNALQAASAGGHEKVVTMLLDSRADVNTQGGFYGNALYAASCRGHEQVVKILFDSKADVNTQGKFYSNALHAASYRGHEQIVKMLLDSKAEVNAQREYYGNAYGNALYAASYEGHKQVVKILLDSEAEVNVQRGYYGKACSNALYAASCRGHEQVVKMLLNSKADVNIQGGLYSNALYAASYGGHEQVVKMLLNSKADINAQDRDYGNALQAASAGGHEQVVEVLLDSKVDNIQGGSYGNALYAASYGGHEQVVKILLNSKADVNAQGSYYNSAVYVASERGHEQVVKMLLASRTNHH